MILKKYAGSLRNVTMNQMVNLSILRRFSGCLRWDIQGMGMDIKRQRFPIRTLMSVIPIVMGICFMGITCLVTSRAPITDTDIVGTIWNSRGVFDVSHGCQMNDM